MGVQFSPWNPQKFVPWLQHVFNLFLFGYAYIFNSLNLAFTAEILCVEYTFNLVVGETMFSSSLDYI